MFVDYDDLVGRAGAGRLANGTVLDGATLQRLACDAGIHRVITKGRSSILDYGTTTRTVPANLYNALVARDQHCRFPDCDSAPEFCEAHHIQHWTHHGPTKLENLVLQCGRHHHLLHMPGWACQLKPDGSFVVTNPDGEVMERPPPGKPPDLFHLTWNLPTAAR